MNFYWYRFHTEFEGSNAPGLLHDVNGRLVRVTQDGGNLNQTVWDWGQERTRQRFASLVGRALDSGISSFFLDKAHVVATQHKKGGGWGICNRVCAAIEAPVAEAWNTGHEERCSVMCRRGPQG